MAFGPNGPQIHQYDKHIVRVNYLYNNLKAGEPGKKPEYWYKTTATMGFGSLCRKEAKLWPDTTLKNEKWNRNQLLVELRSLGNNKKYMTALTSIEIATESMIIHWRV